MTDIAEVRRKDRAVEDEQWVESFLERSPCCVIGTVADGRAFLNPNLFIFQRHPRSFFFHTAGGGRTRTNIENHAQVTVSVFSMGRLLPGEVVTDYSVEYASVTIFGKAVIITDRARVRHVFELQMKKYFPHHRPGLDYVTFTDEEAAKATVYEVSIERWSAKRNEGQPDHPGAIDYSAVLAGNFGEGSGK